MFTKFSLLNIKATCTTNKKLRICRQLLKSNTQKTIIMAIFRVKLRNWNSERIHSVPVDSHRSRLGEHHNVNFPIPEILNMPLTQYD